MGNRSVGHIQVYNWPSLVQCGSGEDPSQGFIQHSYGMGEQFGAGQFPAKPSE